MIVSDEAGTTRDAVEEAVDLGGVAVVLTDTAGLRQAVGAAETEAVRVAAEISGEADLRVVVIDASVPATEEEVGPLRGFLGEGSLIVLNKADRAEGGVREWERFLGVIAPAVLVTSAVTGEGCEALAATIADLARRGQEGELAGTGRLRHRAALEEALQPLRRSLPLLAGEGRAELAAMELRAALARLSSIVDPLGDEEVLDRIFSQFCLGK
jgi:tRNA modification GTPase